MSPATNHLLSPSYWYSAKYFTSVPSTLSSRLSGWLIRSRTPLRPDAAPPRRRFATLSHVAQVRQLTVRDAEHLPPQFLPRPAVVDHVVEVVVVERDLARVHAPIRVGARNGAGTADPDDGSLPLADRARLVLEPDVGDH